MIVCMICCSLIWLVVLFWMFVCMYVRVWVDSWLLVCLCCIWVVILVCLGVWW